MPIKKIKFALGFAAAVVFTGGAQASTEVLLQLDRDVSAFNDYASEEGRLLLISENGQADFTVSGRIQDSRRFRVTHSGCRPRTQNTVSMEAPGGLTYAHPFLVGTDRACILDEKTGSLRLLADFSAGLPGGAFSAVYAGTLDNHSLFLINGREFPGSPSGYIYLVQINRTTFQIKLEKIIEGVPGYSGGMYYDSQKIWITSYPQKLFRMMTVDLHALIRSRRLAQFSDVAAESLRIGNDLSSYLLRNDRYFLYFNDEYESYFIENRHGFRYTAFPPCTPVAGRQNSWLILCDKRSLQRWTPALRSVKSDR